MRTDALAAGLAAASIGAEVALLALADLPALNSIGICLAAVMTGMAVVRIWRTAQLIRPLRRWPWRPLESAWRYAGMGERSASVLLRDPATGEQAVLHALGIPKHGRMPEYALVPVWFPGDLRQGGVLTLAGGGAFIHARTFRTMIGRYSLLPLTTHEDLYGPIVAPAYLTGSMRTNYVATIRLERSRTKRIRPSDQLTVYDSFALDALREHGHVASSPGIAEGLS
jgi:hypothetical protein